MLSKEEIENNKLYKANYMQNPFTLLTKENLDKLEEHCKKSIHFERGIEHSVTLELLYKYEELVEKLEKDVENFKKQNADATLQDYSQEILEIMKGEK